MDEMRSLGVGVPDSDNTPGLGEIGLDGGGVGGHAGGDGDGDGGGSREKGSGAAPLSPECYAPLVEAYAQAFMWDRTIEAYHEGFVGGREGVQPVDYRVSFARVICNGVRWFFRAVLWRENLRPARKVR